ncbi:MAG: MurR/RpiR family transcriptional regulator [Gemmiger sp.]|nr:MurR/RpiR family transcriptional regulator [Gemmiger sp.]
MIEPGSSVLTSLCSGIQFFSAEKRIADYILAHREAAVDMTSAELAKASGTSEATVTRFCKKLSFDNYRAFQLALARDVMEQQQAPEISSEISLDNIAQSLQNILANKIGELNATIGAISPENLTDILGVLRSANIVQVAAVGNTIPVAMDAAFKFNQLGIRCVTSEISEKLAAFALTLTPQDALLIISNSGKSRRLYQIAETARANGVPIILITCDRSAPLAALADYRMISSNREQLLTTAEYAFSRISAISIIEVLYHFLLVSIPNARAAIQRHEALMKHDKSIP